MICSPTVQYVEVKLVNFRMEFGKGKIYKFSNISMSAVTFQWKPNAVSSISIDLFVSKTFNY